MTARRHPLVRFLLLGVLALGFGGWSDSASAEAMDWKYQAKGLGRVLPDSSWFVVRNLGVVTASPEFTLPLQMVYHNSRRHVGLLGGQWHLPLLESSLLPGKNNVLIWTMPNGNVIGLHARRGSSTEFLDGTHTWQAKRVGRKTEIRNKTGWIFRYEDALLQEVESPTRRVLGFSYRGDQLTQVEIRDSRSSARETLLTLKYRAKVLTELATRTDKHQFDYTTARRPQLTSWKYSNFPKAETYTYDRDSSALAQINPANGETETLKTELLRGKSPALTRLVSDSGMTYSYTPSEGGKNKREMKIEAADANGGKYGFEYSSKRGILVNQTPSGSEVTTYYYRAPGQRYDGRLRRVERDGKLMADHKYDPKTGRLAETRDAIGEITFYEYSADPRATPDHPVFEKPVRIWKGSRREKRLVAEFNYDPDGRLISSRNAEDMGVAVTYSPRGEVESIASMTGNETVFSYDPLGRVRSVRKDGRQEEVVYDRETGKVASRKLADGQIVAYVYDERGRMTDVKQGQDTVSSMIYDDFGRVIGKRDGLGRETKYVLDPKGKILEEHAPNGTVSTYGYDRSGRRNLQIDGNGNRVTFKHDTAGRLIEQSGPTGHKLTWEHDTLGRLIKRTNGEQEITYTYNSMGKLAVLSYGREGEKIVYRYDDQGRVVESASPTVTMRYSHDAIGRVVAVELIRDENHRVLRYAYSPSGMKSAVTLSEKAGEGDFRLLHQNEYTYDTLGRLQTLKSNGRLICSYRYDALGRLIGRDYGNGMRAAIVYDAGGRLNRVDISEGPLVEPLTLGYEWDVANQVTRRLWNGQVQTFDYDPAGQLLGVASAPYAQSSSTYRPIASQAGPTRDWAERYRYDPAGNMLEKFEYGTRTSMTYNAANQLLTRTVHPKSVADSDSAPDPEVYHYGYDKAGRQNAIRGPDGEVKRLYGWLDKLVQVEQPDGEVHGFDYYPDGHLAAVGHIRSPEEMEKLNQVEAPAENQDSSTFSALQALRTLITSRRAADREIDDSLDRSESQKAFVPTEEYVWDGLALLWRNGVGYAIEPHPSGGAVVASFREPGGIPTYHVNDMLSTTLAVVRPDKVEIVPMTVFGKPTARLGGGGSSNLTDSLLVNQQTSSPESLSPESNQP